MGKGDGTNCEAGMQIGPGLDDPSWHQGYCAEYAIALVRKHPHLRIGFSAEEDLYEDWDPASGEPAPFTEINHVFAHDDQFAYDSLGKHPLPYFHQWDAGYQPVEEHNYLHYEEQAIGEILSQRWAPRTNSESQWQADQSLVDMAGVILPEELV